MFCYVFKGTCTQIREAFSSFLAFVLRYQLAGYFFFSVGVTVALSEWCQGSLSRSTFLDLRAKERCRWLWSFSHIKFLSHCDASQIMVTTHVWRMHIVWCCGACACWEHKNSEMEYIWKLHQKMIHGVQGLTSLLLHRKDIYGLIQWEPCAARISIPATHVPPLMQKVTCAHH